MHASTRKLKQRFCENREHCLGTVTLEKRSLAKPNLTFSFVNVITAGGTNLSFHLKKNFLDLGFKLHKVFPKMNDNFVIQNARVIDTAQEIDEVTNITVVDGKIHSMGELYPDHFNVLDGSGCIVSPGWIDAHVHCYEHCTPIGINPDKYCLSRGITAVVDAGSAGRSLVCYFWLLTDAFTLTFEGA